METEQTEQTGSVTPIYRTLTATVPQVSDFDSPKLGRKRSTSELNLKEYEKEHGQGSGGLMGYLGEAKKNAANYCSAHLERLLSKSRHLNMAIMEMAMVCSEPEIGKHLVVVLEANTGRNKTEFIQVVGWVCERSIQDITKPELLFREESACTKFISETLFQEGYQFLHGFMKRILKFIGDSSSTYEIDPERELDESVRQKNHDALVEVCNAGIGFIAQNSKKLSQPTTEIFSRVYCQTMAKFGNEVASTCLTGLFFLRYVCPVLVNPEKFGNKAPSPEERKRLIAVSRILQIFANRVKEPAPHHAAVVNEIQAKHPTFLQQLVNNVVHVSSKSLPSYLSLSFNVDEIVNESATTLLQYVMDNKEAIASVLSSFSGRKRASSDQQPKEKKKGGLTNSIKKVVRKKSPRSKGTVAEDLTYEDALGSLETMVGYTCNCKPNNYRAVYSQIESAMQSLKF